MNCASTFTHKCTDGEREKCPNCGYHYCKYHFEVNNSILKAGGHVCL
jgi:hypothetical protein